MLKNLDERKQAELRELQDPSLINVDILSSVAFRWAIFAVLVCSLLLTTLKKQIASTHVVRLPKSALLRRLSTFTSSVWLYNFGTVQYKLFSQR